MRYFIFTIVFLGFIGSSFAQVEKGLWFVSGQVNIELKTSESDFISTSGFNFESSQFTRAIDFSPRVGYMVSNHWLIGADVNLGKLKTSRDQLATGAIPTKLQEWIDTFGVGLFTRRFFNMDENLQVFAEGRIGYSWWEQRFDNNSTNVQTNQTVRNYVGRLSVGLHYWMLPNLSLEINAPFLTLSSQEVNFLEIDSRPIPVKQIDRGIGFAFGQSIGIGFNFIF